MTDVNVVNFVEVTEKQDALLEKIDIMLVHTNTLQLWVYIIVWLIFFGVACWVTSWLWRTWIRGLIDSYNIPF